jgi:hypothetical protein
MAQFIHLTDERLAKHVTRTGIKTSELWGSEDRFVYATPVLKDFMISHQWLRELKRRGIRTICAIQFRVSDDEPARVGHYWSEMKACTAAEAVAFFMQNPKALGLQVVFERKIVPKEIMRIYDPPQVSGWRYFPGAHSKKPCGCPLCLRKGEIKSRKIRDEYENG